MKKLLVISLLIFNPAFCFPCTAQETGLFSFTDTNGIFPRGSLMYSNSLLYGMTSYGGLYNNGCIFSIDTNFSDYHDLHDFYDTLGSLPYGSLILSDSTLFGMTSGGGKFNKGCIFSMYANGASYKVLHSFNDTDGGFPSGSLINIGNILYGMTDSGSIYKYGSIFSIDTNGSAYKILHTFNDTAGAYPAGSLLLSDSILFGMASRGGAYDSGCLFALSIRHADSGYKIIHTFSDGVPFSNDTDGAIPEGGLILSGKRLFGMTSRGGIYYRGNVFSIDTSGRNYLDLFNFNSFTGNLPQGSLLLNGKLLYGMTSHGSANGYGTVFSVDTNGEKFKQLLNFNSYNGAFPSGDLLNLDTILFGMTEYGGTDNVGVIFRVDTSSIYSSSISSITYLSSVTNIFPNPNNGIFTIKASEPSGPFLMEFYNAMGEQVYSKNYQPVANSYQAISIDLSALPSGFYFFRLLSIVSIPIAQGKFIIQK